MAKEKEVKVRVSTEAEMSDVEKLENRIKQLKTQKIKAKLEADTAELEEANRKIQGLKIFLDNVNTGNTNIHVNDDEIEKAKAELASLESKVVDLEIDVETGKLKEAEAEIEKLDDSTIDVNVDNISAMEAVDQIGQGFDRLKQGAREVGEQLGTVLEAAGKQETNKTFLEQAVGDPAVAQQKMNEIADIVQNLPGDDTAVQGLLSQAIAKDASLATDQLQAIGTAYADYASAMSFYGKSGIEAQQDMTNYILAGNTAELERSPILASHIDKLKEATTIQERSQALQEALNEEHWGGMSQQDTFNNKLETFNGMLDRGKYNLGGMFQEGAKAGMDFVMNLDNATNGMVGMGIALAGFASPLTDSIMGLGQMATGMKAIKDLGMIQWLRDFEIMTKLSAAADWLLAAAQGVLNAIMSMNPIVLVVIALIALAAALIWAYQNVDWFREMVDNAFASLVQIGQIIYGYVMGAIQWLSDLFNNFTSQLGLNTNDWVQAIIGFILFLPTLPFQVGIALANALAKALGFKGNFVQSLYQTAVDAVNGFSNAIQGIWQAVQQCLDWAYNVIMSHPIVQAAIWLGEAIANGFSALGLGQNSPGKIVKSMRQELDWTEEEIENNSLVSSAITLADNIAGGFNPSLNTSSGSGSGHGQTINLHVEVGTVDSEDRVREIIDVIRRELNWNNQTAGRTV